MHEEVGVRERGADEATTAGGQAQAVLADAVEDALLHDDQGGPAQVALHDEIRAGHHEVVRAPAATVVDVQPRATWCIWVVWSIDPQTKRIRRPGRGFVRWSGALTCESPFYWRRASQTDVPMTSPTSAPASTSESQ